ncbi:MAG: cyclic nucleotide-binding domain-containing protein [Gammaproteobacteria bacterium]|nr:cyclic nucleotide-binding domain-containing protein [Gammaproteobacteria bacterium]
MEHINKIAAFEELDATSLRLIDSKISWRKYAKNALIFNRHEQSKGVFFVASGSVKATTYSLSGKQIAFQNLTVGEMFGEVASIDGQGRTTSVVVLEDSIIGVMNEKDFWWMMHTYPIVVKAVLLKPTGIIRFLCDRIYEYGALNVADRVRAEILRLAKNNIVSPNRAEIKDMPTHEDIANLVSTHREAVTREFSRITCLGIIAKENGTLIVTNIEQLEALISEFV